MALKNKTDLTSSKNSAIADNTSGAITPAIDRAIRQDVIDSMLNQASGNPEQTVQSSVDFTGGLKVNGTLVTGGGTPTIVSIAVGDSPYSASWGEDIEVDCSGGAVTVNLPAASGNSGQSIFVTKTDNSLNEITIDGNGAETINGDTTKKIANQWSSVTLRSNGTNVGIR